MADRMERVPYEALGKGTPRPEARILEHQGLEFRLLWLDVQVLLEKLRC